MKKPWILLLSFAIPLLLIGTCCGIFWLSPYGQDIRRIRLQEAAMQTPEVYKPIAEDLALYCQSTDQEFRSWDPDWLPQSIRRQTPRAGELRPDGAHVEMGGGFHHYGYDLVRDDAASSEEEMKWDLHFYSESGIERLLHSVRLPRDQKLPIEARVAPVLHYYDKRIASKRREASNYQNKVYPLVRLDHCELARETCRDALKPCWKHWWPRLTLALMTPAEDGENVAIQAFRDWVAKRPTYSRYFYLSYYYTVMGNSEHACEAIRNSLERPLNTVGDDRDSVNCWSMGYYMVTWARQFGCNDTALALCEKMIDANPSDNHLADTFAAMRAQLKAELADGDSDNTQPLPVPQDPGESRPFGQMDVDELRACAGQ